MKRKLFTLESVTEGHPDKIAIEHSDGTISLTKFDISKEIPKKIDHTVKEAK